MMALRLMTDIRARPALLFGAFVVAFALFSLFSLFDTASMLMQNKQDAQRLAQLKERSIVSPEHATPVPESYVITENNHNLAAAAFQKTLSTLALELGITLQSVETRTPQPDDPPGQILAEIQFEVDEHQLGAFLHKIENFKPAIIFDRLLLAAAKDRDAQTSPRLQGTARVISAWRAHP